MTLRELISERFRGPNDIRFRWGPHDISVEGGTLDMEVGTLQDRVLSWSDEPFDSDRTWPVPGVPRPSYASREGYEGTWVFPDVLCVGYNLYHERHGYLIRVYPRTPDAAYWPSEEECRAAVPEWAERLWTEMLTYVGRDCDTSPNVTPAAHWEMAKRRYGLKDNQTCRLAFVARVDPEGRHRCSPRNPLPEHVERWLRYADFLVGIRAGVRAEDAAAGLYASGGALDEDELAEWCQRTWKTS